MSTVYYREVLNILEPFGGYNHATVVLKVSFRIYLILQYS